MLYQWKTFAALSILSLAIHTFIRVDIWIVTCIGDTFSAKFRKVFTSAIMAQTFPNPHCTQCAGRISSVFGSLPESDLPVLTQQKVCRHYNKGESIFFTGDQAAGLYCVHSGKIKVFKSGSDGREQIVRLVKPGDALGYRALISGGEHSVSAVAFEHSHVCFVPRAVFFSLLSSRPMFSLRLFEVLAEELESAERMVVEMAQKPIRERLAEALLLLRSTYGIKDDAQTLDVRITREDLAGIVGAATESVIRNLAELKDEGIIGLDGRTIQVLDLSALVNAANVKE